MFTQEDFKRDAARGLKIIGNMNTVIHCHHYNSRLQRTLEMNTKIDGKKIIKEAAAQVYFELLTTLKNQKNSTDNLELAASLFKFLGFGILDFSNLNEGLVISPFSHYVEGWQCGSINTEGCVCRVTEGYIEGAVKAILGRNISATEVSCYNQIDTTSCHFKIVELVAPKYDFNITRFEQFSFSPEPKEKEVASNIDKSTIVQTIMDMPLEGNNEGLIPAFNVYLAHTPQDFYNKVCINFIKEMDRFGFVDIAKEMLVEDAENCALNTFAGILDSEEWDALISPMIKEDRDKIFGLVAVANALGWGRINVKEHNSIESLELTSSNGYEAFGYIELEEYSNEPKCFMLRGITAGLMELVYEKGELEDRVGKFNSTELTCLTQKNNCCHFLASYSK